MGEKRRRHHPKKSASERMWAVLLVLGFLALIMAIALYYVGPEAMDWVNDLLRDSPAKGATP